MSRILRWVSFSLCIALAACGGATSPSAAPAEASTAALALPASKAASMANGRFGHTATLLADGRVLVAGGFTGHDNRAFRECEIYDPATNRWSRAAPMLMPRGWGRAVTLNDGRVMVIGGLTSGWWGKMTYAGNEIYDPATDTWTRAASSARRTGHTATKLADGRILVTGGSNSTKYPARYGSLTSAEIYDPATDHWTAAAPLPRPRGEHTAALQPDGKVLVAGYAIEHDDGEQTRSKEGSIDLYDPAADRWSRVAKLGDEASWGLTAALPDGRVLINAAEFDLATRTWKAAQGLALDRPSNAPFVLYPDGSVMVAGGGWNLTWDYGFNDTAVHEIYDALARRWSVARSLSVVRDDQSMTLLPDGRVLLAGGRDPAYNPLTQAEFIERAAPARRRAVRNDLDGDGRSDILWRHRRSGAIERWAMNALAPVTVASVRGATDDTLVAVGDLDADGRADLVWDTGGPGSATGWLMKGQRRTATVRMSFSPNTRAWTVADLDGDDRVLPVWREDRAGATIVLKVDPTNRGGETWSTDAQLSVVGSGDFDGDRRDDLVFSDSRDGSTSVWRMHGPRRLGEPVPLWRDSAWKLVAVADFDGDGKPDLLRRSSAGVVEMWLMDGTAPVTKTVLLADAKWTAGAAGDLDGDGRADLLWHKASSGTTAAWLMNGAKRISRQTLRVDRDWVPVL